MAAIRRVFLCLLSFVLFSTGPLTMEAQQSNTTTPKEKKITLDIAVTPDSGHPVAGLTQNDFKILDNKTPQAITSFAQLGGQSAPVQVLLVLDAINATFTTVSTERDQIEHFLRSHGEHLSSPTSLAVVTDTGIFVQQGSSTDGKALSAALDQYTMRLRTLRRSTGFYGASDRTNLSLHALDQLAAQEGAKPGRKLILWVSPGWPLLSGPAVMLTARQQSQIFSSVVGLSTTLREDRITLYALDALGATESVFRSTYYQSFTQGLSKTYDANIGNLGLQVFAVQSGGLVLNSNDLGTILQRSLDDVTAYYEVTYDPPPAEHNDEYHAIQVHVDKPGLKARTMKGYYSQQ
ncbi:VWA domain-containing protein [Edaphobacter sp. HDX4]|uniref:VWA domain-containing protein n=1 Tax=Edaphobacter sp. HDX4 TaxID=2794064 RepID=UPI002FE5555C